MKLKELSKYILLVVSIASVAFIIDLISSNISVELSTKTILDINGTKISSLQVTYPLWKQVSSLVINFLYGLAAAVFITVFVVNRLERSQQNEKQAELNELNKAININVFDSLFKTIIPEEIFKVIKQEIIENKVLRREAKWIYDFSVNGTSIKCRMTTSYELHNVSQENVVDPVKLELDTLGGNKYKIISAKCLNTTGEILVQYNSDDIANNKNINVDDKQKNKLIVEYTINIPPESHVEYQTIFERSYEGNIVDAQITKVPVVGADIIVNFPEEYDFDISPMMSSKPRLITESSKQKIYRVEGGILPYQGFMYYLVKNANKDEEQTV
ncbi:hypothetical protein [Sulfurovum sp.]|uniref:hypothetical protein n=1 Tax=Sulfurovum sp. TaxID=1969726 RepID=UPI0035614CDF